MSNIYILKCREVYGMGKRDRLYFVFRILYVLVTGKKPVVISIPLIVFSFTGFEEEMEEDLELQEFHSWHAKASSRNAWIFHYGLDTRHSKRYHFIVRSCPCGYTSDHSASGRWDYFPLLYADTTYMWTAPAQTAIRLFSQLGALTIEASLLLCSTGRHQIHDNVQSGLLWAKVVETRQRQNEGVDGKKVVASLELQGKVRFSVGIWRLEDRTTS